MDIVIFEHVRGLGVWLWCYHMMVSPAEHQNLDLKAILHLPVNHARPVPEAKRWLIARVGKQGASC